MKKIAIALSMVLATGVVMAQDAGAGAATDGGSQQTNIYGELGFTRLNGDNPNLFTGKFHSNMMRGILGTKVNPWLGGELMLGIKMDSGKGSSASGPQVQTEVKTLLGLYAKPTLDLGRGQLYARAGLANITFSDVPVPASGPLQTTGIFSHRNSFSWGVGGSYKLTDQMSLNADYMVYYKRNNEKLDGLTLSLGYHF